ncbi:MAG TPA: D-aminoacyl-tRNA deacylase [Candidatus Limnocylindria bacterium]|jgi:D-tyrosyl-tRNA(Tyr) deacylase|nr:D-aminoacyl-tRNA deacylase [Candidatus Limnocylindria bacterium]
MRIVLQRVSEASVSAERTLISKIGPGYLVLVGCEANDTAEELDWLAQKLVNLRLFDDDAGVMNRSILDVSGEVLLVSQFTLLASTKKGTRPSWHRAAKPEVARSSYEAFVRRVGEVLGRPPATGIFGADMRVELVNDGPVTLILDSRLKE